ncbi:MAG: hypothetical protein E7576_00855 [Ruminococcaceae bacterium]|jgi:hypothetical protein|nr:hypothetical protein [Oscillospiraceae bacterium]
MKAQSVLSALSALLFLALILPAASGCEKEPVPSETVPQNGIAQEPEIEAAPEEEPELPRNLPLFDQGGASLFSVVMPADADEETAACASALVKALNKKTGKYFKLADDSSDADPDAFEILVGSADRPESEQCAALFASLETEDRGSSVPLETYGGYLMIRIGHKICLCASDGGMFRKAADDFAENWLGADCVNVPESGQTVGVREPVTLTPLTAETRPAAVESADGSVIAADIVATDAAYGADPTGKKDSGPAIRKALTACAAKGGGTVWLPAGQYLVTSTVEIPAFVTLYGQAAKEDPKTIEDCGTVIVAKPKSGKSPAASLFVLRGSCGAVGLTVWYPEQSLENPVTYPYTFYITGNGQGGYMLQTVRDVFVVNGWCGIGACVTENNAHEQTTVENFRGTFLSHAAKSFNEADVGTWKSIRVSPSFWADSPFENAPDYEALAAYTRENAEGLVLGDLEWDQFADIEIEDALVGIHTVKGNRVTFNGEMADVTLRRCGTGLLVDDMDQRWGMNLARAVFEDCGETIVNRTRAMIKLTGVTFPAGSSVSGVVRTAEGDLSSCAVDYSRTYEHPVPAVYTAKLASDNSLDVSRDLQDALNQVGAAGGGTFYLPAGIYRLERPVTVPEGVELRGSSSVATRGQSGWSKGTLISSSYGMGLSASDPALLTLSAHAGVNGIRFVYPENGPAIAAATPFVIRGTGSGVYCVNVSIAAAGSGVDFSGCDGHFVKKVTACCYDRGVVAGGSGGYIEGCLQNATVMMRHGLNFVKNWIPESEVFDKLFPILRTRSVFLTLDGANDEQVLNYFAYGVMTVLEVRNSENVLVVNLGGDNIGDKAPLIRADSSSLAVVNAQRYNGVLYETAGDCDFSFYNPLTIGNIREKNLIHGEEFSFGPVNGD